MIKTVKQLEQSRSSFRFEARVWLYPEMAGWHFVSVPSEVSNRIDFSFGDRKRGFGSLPVVVTVGKTEWRTSIFPDKKSGCYLLPVKANVRKKEGISENDVIKIVIGIQK